jgi:hypothetical protein
MTEQITDIDVTDEDEAPNIIRAKWTIDGATTLAEAAAKLRQFADELDQKHAEGWTLEQPVEDDYGFLVPPASP